MKEQKRNRGNQPGSLQESRKENQPGGWRIGGGPALVPVETKTNHSEYRHQKMHLVSLTAALLFVMLGLTVAVSCYKFSTLIQARLDIRPGEHAKKRALSSGKTGEPKPVEAGSFRVVLSQLSTIETGNQDYNIEYENPEENHYSSRISLYLKGAGRLMDGITRVDPGCYVESVRLKESLLPGEYPVTVRIELLEGKAPTGGISIDIALRTIENQGGETE